MPSSADGHSAAQGGAAERICTALRTLAAGVPPVVLIDGRSGSGKTTLAARVSQLWGDRIQTVALDDLYPGWDGLREGATAMREQILAPFAAGRTATWHRWDWELGAPGAPVTTVSTTPLIIEGAGALTAESAALTPVRVWVEAPDAVRKQRALDRDGDTYAPHWERWAAQERRHIAEEDPRALATIVVDVP